MRYLKIKIIGFLIALLFALFLQSGCKDATMAQLESLSARHKITCYSGGVVIYQGESTGNVSNEAQSDGWYWRDATTGKLIESSGQCVFVQE